MRCDSAAAACGKKRPKHHLVLVWSGSNLEDNGSILPAVNNITVGGNVCLTRIYHERERYEILESLDW